MPRTVVLIVPILLLGAATRADVLTFENDYAGFVEAAGPLSEIDFETMPDGQPTEVTVELTEDFNYDDEGVHFSAPYPYPFFAGNPWTGLQLWVEQNGQDTWIIADLVAPATAVGAFFPGSTELCVFDSAGTEIACEFFSDPGEGNFIGMVSDVPIHSATFASGADIEAIDGFVFSPVPEPGTLVLLASGLALTVRRKRRD